jgi:hypothetical protein
MARWYSFQIRTSGLGAFFAKMAFGGGDEYELVFAKITLPTVYSHGC